MSSFRCYNQPIGKSESRQKFNQATGLIGRSGNEIKKRGKSNIDTEVLVNRCEVAKNEEKSFMRKCEKRNAKAREMDEDKLFPTNRKPELRTQPAYYAVMFKEIERHLFK